VRKLSGSIPLLLLCTLLVTAQAQVRDSLPVPDLPGYRTLKCDLHMHTVFSDGEVWPTTRITEAFRDGLDAISLTDHGTYHPHEKDVGSDAARPHELARAQAERMGIILIPGIEVNEGDTHANVLFPTDPNALHGNNLKEVLRRARQQDAFVFWNHPGWKQKPDWFPLIAACYDEKLIQGVELINGSTFYPEVFPWIEEKKLTILATSDVHAPLAPGRTRPITLVLARTADAPGIREALLARRTIAWMGGEMWGAEEHLRGLWQGAVKLENPALSWRPGIPGVVLRLRNSSAIPFRFRILRAPAWLAARDGEVREEKTAGVPVTIRKDIPAGRHQLELELEITNLHVAPGRNLTVRLPFTLEVGKS